VNLALLLGQKSPVTSDGASELEDYKLIGSKERLLSSRSAITGRDEAVFSWQTRIGYRDVRLANARSLRPLLSGLHAWLSSTDHARPADLIFVLAGEMSRKHYAVQLFREGLAPRLLLSVGRFEIRRFQRCSADTGGSFETGARRSAATAPLLCFVPKQRMARGACPAKAVWHSYGDCIAGALARRESGSSIVILISNEAHLRRIRMCADLACPRCGSSAACSPNSFSDSGDQQSSAIKSRAATYWNS